MTIVSTYGLHKATGGIGFLMQEIEPQHALPVDLTCPFTLDRPPARCPHRIDLSQRAAIPAEATDPLFAAMAPTPGQGEVFQLNDFDAQFRPLVAGLTRLSSPTGYFNMAGAWEIPTHRLMPLRRASNLGTLVLFDVCVRDMLKIVRLVEQPRAPMRRVLLLASERLPRERGITIIETKLDLSVLSLPLERIGAQMLHKEMMQ